ncbi:MarR family transcriptional regulator [Streptomyces sp. ATCC51928]|uniref:MarR family transcriptional regulator n=1 Tax=Streptomyces caviscabies TaxID=90079 RepID=A0ABW2MF19_9ACTN|nr:MULTISPECIES: MarR family transcriptional regulator [unclassified Streptomyces]MDX3507301.1 MarR family transcriptional regulator [Streptomyces sp. ATCC51928]MDX5520346.1 MarR family transcriptional regulator [Streptomyces sp. DE06-01C]
MATKHPSSALPAPALSAAYPMANPGYGKRSAPHQLPRTREDFSLLPTRERYVAGFVDHLPEGASMSVKQLAKQLPLYGQQAISTALTALSVAGHLRRVRCSVTSASDETRWVFRTFWSRTARDSEWWNAYLATENNSPDEAPAPEEPDAEPAPEATGVPQQPTPAQAPDTAPAQPRTAEPGPAYLALARLGRNDHRLALSADDCTALEPLATQWLDRGVSVDYLTSALAAGLPAQVDSPLGFLRRRLTDKMPPRLPAAENSSPGSPAPTRRILMECTDCGRPGQPEALPDGLCRPCRTAHRPDTPPAEAAEAADVRARMTNLRDLLKTV